MRYYSLLDTEVHYRQYDQCIYMDEKDIRPRDVICFNPKENNATWIV